jgi:hypothetical protein
MGATGCTPFGHQLQRLAVELCALHDVSLFAHMAELMLDFALGRHHEQFGRQRSTRRAQSRSRSCGRSLRGPSTPISVSSTPSTFTSETHSLGLQRQQHASPAGLGSVLARHTLSGGHSASATHPFPCTLASSAAARLSSSLTAAVMRNTAARVPTISVKANPSAIASLFSCLVRAEGTYWGAVGSLLCRSLSIRFALFVGGICGARVFVCIE